MLDLAIVRALVARTQFAHLRYVSQTTSTNEDAALLLGAAGSAGLVLVTDYQSAGRGRRTRSWIAPAASALLFTAILPKPIASSALWAVPFWTALGVADGIAGATGLAVRLQWPNDLLLADGKCCGILATSRVSGEQAWVGCGVGVNVLRPSGDADLAAIVPAPAFLSDRVPSVTREALLGAILCACDRRLALLEDPTAVARAWEARAELAGTPYRIEQDSGERFDGIAQRIAADGSLIVRTPAGERHVTLADARVVREP
ncbi:MAG TPA: biotin--[acetyl-CoA-carboxylase] ligase [Candidatus Baltobacteraceae bacterium]